MNVAELEKHFQFVVCDDVDLFLHTNGETHDNYSSCHCPPQIRKSCECGEKNTVYLYLDEGAKEVAAHYFDSIMGKDI